MQRQFLRLFQPQQKVQDAAVAQEHLGRLDQPLAQVLEPGRQYPDHVGAGQQVPVVIHRRGAHVHRARQLRGVPGLSMVVRQHPPEAPQRVRRHLRPQPRNVALQEGARERLHPARPGRGRRRQPGARKPAAHPEPVLVLRAHFGQREAANVDEEDAARQGFGNALDQIPGSAAEQQEHGVPVPGVADRAQHLEQRRQPLYLVDDYQPLGAAQQPFGSGRQRLPHGSHFQVVERHRPGPGGRRLLGEGGLAHLPRPQQRHRRRLGETAGGGREQCRPRY